MLRLLRIRNLALIRELEIEFGRGLNLLTGETGSGKSILVDALGLLLGARSSQEMIRSECEMAVLEGIFEIDACKSILDLLGESGYDSADHLLLIRREISMSGRNRVFINNSIATLSLLKVIGEKLADIHGQQEQKSLLDLSTHLEWLDDFGCNNLLVQKVRASFRKVREISRQLDLIEINEQDRLRRIDILQFQIEEIRRINPQPNEKESLEHERSLLTNHEKILALATAIYESLYESESSILMGVNQLERNLKELEGYDRHWGPHLETLQECRYKLEDISYVARDYAARSEYSAERLETVHQRLLALEKLTKKYGSSSEAILDYGDKCSRELEELVSGANSVAQLNEQLKMVLTEYKRYADSLSEKRRSDALNLELEIKKEFTALAMERMEMRVHFHALESESEIKGRVPAGYGLNGIDHVEFLIAPNKGEEIRSLARIASGGELSRLMLSIKSLCGNEEVDRTLVFDEVDTGIGGRVAEAVGKRLREISRENQVLCVTHLPQIAAFAQNHFNVHKEIVEDRTETSIRQLKEPERIEELSRMLGGETITQATKRYAVEMLERSQSDKKESYKHSS